MGVQQVWQPLQPARVNPGYGNQWKLNKFTMEDGDIPGDWEWWSMDGLDLDTPENWNMEHWHLEFWSLINGTESRCEMKQLNTELFVPADSELGLWIGEECNWDEETYEWDNSYCLSLYDESEAIPTNKFWALKK